MFPIRPPDDPFLINTNIFGFALEVRWYGVLIIGGAMLAAWVAGRRAERRGYNPEDVWNLLLLGLVLGIAGARAYYVAFEWERYAGQILAHDHQPAGRRAGHPRGDHRRSPGRVYLHAPAEAAVCRVARHLYADDAGGAGGRSLGQLLQPGSLWPTDKPALWRGYPDGAAAAAL